MAQANIVDAKYVFLDVVGFTRGRHVEAQASIVEKLNEIVRHVLDVSLKVPEKDRILIPAGDGICIVLLGRDAPYDAHVQVAFGILARLDAHNENTADEMLRFEVRVGLNENRDNEVTDINGNRNMAGAGINVAQRVMSSADGNQILVSNRVYDVLRYRRDFMDYFRSYTATAKHGEKVPVHQLVKVETRGLNLQVPEVFRKPEKRERKLSKHAAYYLAHAIRNRPILVEKRDELFDDEAIIILLHFMAADSVRDSEASDLESPYHDTYMAGSATFFEQYTYYRKQDTSIRTEFSHWIRFGTDDYLSWYSSCFAEDSFGLSDFRAVSEHGKRRLKQDWPNIWAEFDLDKSEGETSQRLPE